MLNDVLRLPELGVRYVLRDDVPLFLTPVDVPLDEEEDDDPRYDEDDPRTPLLLPLDEEEELLMPDPRYDEEEPRTALDEPREEDDEELRTAELLPR